jgi:hypothetical protein
MVTSMLVIQDLGPRITIASAPSSILGERDFLFALLQLWEREIFTPPLVYFPEMTAVSRSAFSLTPMG